MDKKKKGKGKKKGKKKKGGADDLVGHEKVVYDHIDTVGTVHDLDATVGMLMQEHEALRSQMIHLKKDEELNDLSELIEFLGKDSKALFDRNAELTKTKELLEKDIEERKQSNQQSM